MADQSALAELLTRVQLLPDVLDLSLVPTGSGLGSLLMITSGAAMRYEPERLARLSLFGTLAGGLTFAIYLVANLLFEVP